MAIRGEFTSYQNEPWVKKSENNGGNFLLNAKRKMNGIFFEKVVKIATKNSNKKNQKKW